MQLYVLMLLCLLVGWSNQTVDNNEVDIEVEQPLKDAVKNIQQEQNMENIGNMIGSLMQNGGAKEFLEGMLQQQPGAGGLLDALSSLSNQGGKDNKEGDGAEDLLKGLGNLASLVGAFQGGNNNNGEVNPLSMLQGLGSLASLAGALQGRNQDDGAVNPLSLLQGLGSLMSGGNKKGGADDILGNLASLFAEEPAEKKPSKKKSGKKKSSKTADAGTDDFNWGDMLSMASSFMGDSGKSLFEKGPGELMPMILQTINAFVGPEAHERALEHSSHAGFMPAALESAHLFFDNFLHSELGKSMLATLGADKTFKVFMNKEGNFDYDKFMDLIENHSFRKHWIQKVTVRIIKFLQSFSNSFEVLKWLENLRKMVNAFFKAQGFPDKVLLTRKDPVNSISEFLDYFVKVYLDLPFSSKPYVEPAVAYAIDVYRMANDSLGNHREPKELSDKLADTINLDIIEPIVRVNRAYRFAKKTPTCDRYVYCTINQGEPTGEETLPGLKKLLTWVNSVMSGWFLTSYTKTSFWDLYSDVTVQKSCMPFYKAECEGFHDQEMRVTTEYVHNEL